MNLLITIVIAVIPVVMYLGLGPGASIGSMLTLAILGLLITILDRL